MIADRIVIENNEIIFRLDLETAGANAAEIAVRARDEAVEARDIAVQKAEQTAFDRVATAADRTSTHVNANLSQAWAEGTEPGGEGTRSAKEWAESAAVKYIKNEPFTYPSWWIGDRIPISIKNERAVFDYNIEDNFDLSTYTPYYVSPTGNNSNDGLTEVTPKASVSNAIAAGAKLIYMLPGVYRRDQFILASTDLAGNDLIIIGIGDVFISQAQHGLSWTVVSGNTYTANRSTVRTVFDSSLRNDYGYFAQLTRVFSQAECESTPGTWFQAIGATPVMVHTHNGRIPDASILVNVALSSTVSSDSGRLFWKNINLLGINVSIGGKTSNSTLEIYLKDVRSPYGLRHENSTLGYNNFAFNSFKKCILDGCVSINSSRDGFNYHNTLNVPNPSTIIELNCKSYNAGTGDADTNNQCSTVHTGAKIIRLNGEYYGGNQQTIADTGIGTQTIMVGCELNTGNIQPNTHVFYGNKSFINGCKFFGNKRVLSEDNTDGVTIRNSILEISGTQGTVHIQP